MEEEKNIQNTKEQDNSILYVVGAVVVIAVVVAAVLMWPKTKTEKKGTATSPTPGQIEAKSPITKLTCDKQWYNPMIGFSKFYLSSEGSDVTSATKAVCTFTVMDETNVIATETAQAVFTAVPERNGSTFVCTTKAMEHLPVGTELTMITSVVDDKNMTASCSGNVVFQTQ